MPGSTVKGRLVSFAAVLAACQGSIDGTGPHDEPASRGGADNAGSGGGTAGASGTVASCGAGPHVGAGKWRRLTAAQYRNSVRDLLGVVPDTTGFLQDTATGPFAANALLAPQSDDIEHYRVTAESVATAAVADVSKLLSCDTKATSEDACAAKFIDDFGLRAFRRPLTAEEKAAFNTVYTTGKQESFAVGLRLIVEAMLQAPSFLYLAEFGTQAAAKLSGYEVSARLSYLMWNSTPDAALLEAARMGVLDTPEGVKQQAERLMTSPRFLEAVGTFHTQLLGTDTLGRAGVVTRDSTKFPDFDAGMRQSMMEETRKFVEYVFTKGDSSVATLLQAPYAFPVGSLGKIYGASLGAVGADGRAEVKDGTRAGLLTLPGVLAAHPTLPTLYQAVARGKNVRLNLLCEVILPPATGVKFMAPPNADKLSQQELLRAHQDNPSCKSCHELMDNIGFAFETYDLVGRYRTTGNDGKAIDASGEIVGTDVAGKFAGTRGLVEQLARSQDVRACMSTQWFRYALARDPGDADACSRAAVDKALADAGGDVRKALLALVTSDVFRFRNGGMQ